MGGIKEVKKVKKLKIESTVEVQTFKRQKFISSKVFFIYNHRKCRYIDHTISLLSLTPAIA